MTHRAHAQPKCGMVTRKLALQTGYHPSQLMAMVVQLSTPILKQAVQLPAPILKQLHVRMNLTVPMSLSLPMAHRMASKPVTF
mmetsp:Transcript_131132/g.226999  ORF Transcript_131132/g.226999 Transcript_131132/m.226999 type:complete len:83 (+) Transcript_131132:365-613(+)